MKILVILPTYNEEKSVGIVIESLLIYSFLDILVVDDNSNDKTGSIVKELMKESPKVNLLERPSKLGLGTAYISGFRWGFERGYDLFFEMDADLSHDHTVIPNFIKKVEEGYDMVVGSRYLHNTISVVGWGFKRLILSKFGNWYASTLLGLKQFTDITSGYRCYTRKALEVLGFERVKSNGYAFHIEMSYRGYKKGIKISEISIIFYEREGGSSKMSRKIIKEAVFLPFKLIFERITQRQ